MSNAPHSRAELDYHYGVPNTIKIINSSSVDGAEFTAHRFENISEAELIAREILLLVQQADLRS